MVWTAAEIAEATGLTRRHVSRLIKQGEIEGELKAALWIVSDEEAERFIEGRAEKAEAPTE